MTKWVVFWALDADTHIRISKPLTYEEARAFVFRFHKGGSACLYLKPEVV